MKNAQVSHIVQSVKYISYKTTVFFILLILVAGVAVPLSSSESVDQSMRNTLQTIDGQILFAPMDSSTTYLIDRNGTVTHTWSSSFLPGEAVCWLGDGTILRSIKVGGSGSGGSGGGVQEMQWDGTVIWDYRCNTDGNLSHHDIKVLPNGDVLLIVWQYKTRSDAIAAGRNPNNIQGNIFMPDKILEVRPTGPTSGEVVWEWNVWDHLIQDFDSSKANYGVVEDHPELVDINYAASFGYDWTHTNSIDYNVTFDQILISIHNFNEIWVIDHSTTTEEAAGHSGGRYGKGGDLLYRWGNPAAYRRGGLNDQQLFNQHDVTWIKSGCPGAGDILIFNNGPNRPSGQYSTVDELVPPINNLGEYYLPPGGVYGPTAPTWEYIANPPSTFYASFLSGAQRLTDGNTLICNGEKGTFFEVTPNGNTVWNYTNPYPSPLINRVFKVVFIPPAEPPAHHVPYLDCSGSLSWTDVKPGDTVYGNIQVRNIGDNGSLLNWSINLSSITWGTWTIDPDHGDNLKPEDGTTMVNITVIAPDEFQNDFEGFIRVENQQDPTNFKKIPVTLVTPADTLLGHLPPLLQLLLQFLQRHPFFQNLWEIILHCN
jgi:hypothetical protein